MVSAAVFGATCLRLDDTTHFPKGTGSSQSCFLSDPDFDADLKDHKSMTEESKNELLEIKRPME